ncbi:DUF1552 domain-containing protein [bacterium]|nr:DUF1552 domain-containing protein [Verrucomicrobiota bacterium]MDA7536312.1 DUF1552 domain-containing protein [bacterium]MDB4705588.1 DUF1552 domain-containing protein [Verrucomicrobiota bacterium]MDB4776884.1 DUF1552 domain-containing protein [Verrucomicrobiota bacterium]MDC0323612.1 DUF1552 domain-containing protein [Verrucomicrobiota bacterium]
MNAQFNRRYFLRGTGALIALPALESIGFRRFASAAATAPSIPSKRAVFLGFGFGVTKETWYPDPEDTGPDYRLSPGLKSLARHKSDFTVVQGCSNMHSNEAHWGSTFWLTGANRYSVPGQNMANSISADQVVARQLGQDTRFSSIQLNSSDGKASGHGPGLSLAWDSRGKPVGGFNDPVKVYHKLFSADEFPLEQRQSALAEKRSVLDAVLTEARRVQRGLTKTDNDKLDEYFQGIRDIELRLGKEEDWLDIPKVKAPLEEPASGFKGKDEIKVMYDLIVAALQTDSTRVMTYRMPGQTLLQSMDISLSAHNVSHYSPGARMQASQVRDKVHSELLAGLIDKLKATSEADGSSLFDHVALAFGSNISSIHFLDNCPTILTGGGARLKLGQHLVLPKDTPLCNVWLTMLQGMGIKAERHGDSSGVVKELQV